MTATELERAREAFARQAWAEVCDAYAAANKTGRTGLTREDHERHAVASYLVGADDACDQAWESAHRAAIEADEPAEAARYAVLLGLCFVLRGQMARAGGWLARAETLLADAVGESRSSGWVLVPRSVGALGAGEHQAALDMSSAATEVGRRFGDPDLVALGVLGQGQALIGLGETASGMARFDEVMVSATAGELGPVVTGMTYCAVIVECLRLFDLARAAEWTGALSAWCDAQPGLVPYRGQCLVHRSQVQQAAGEWPEAISAAQAACRHLTDPPHPALGFAHYQDAELHRLTGSFEQADAGYRQASRYGHDPMPGLALLELARGDVDKAARSIRRALQEARKPFERPGLLAAAVEVLRAAGDLTGARSAAAELTKYAAASPSAVLHAMAAHASGAVLLADGDPVGALHELRAAVHGWQSLRLPYEGARTAVLLGLACAAIGDRSAAELELDNARAVFAELGARPDLERVDALAGVGRKASDRLSRREVEVLAHLASGKTNREIADALVISQHTVGRHVENIFAKLGVRNRAAATAYAYEHGLL